MITTHDHHQASKEKSAINHIYLSKINPSLSQEKMNALLETISKENREKCQRFKFKVDALRTLYGELLLRYGLRTQFSFENKNIKLSKNESGKPYIKGYPIHFNISHAGDFVVCAFSEQEVGIDIEQIRDVELDIAKRFFCQREYVDLLAQNQANQLDYFYSLWTLKESYIKFLGTGLSTPLDSFCFTISETGISFVDNNRKTTPFFKQFFIEGYKLAVCSTTPNFPDQMEKISLVEMTF